MKLAFLSAFPPYRGGISQFSTALVKQLRNDHEVSAFTFTRQYPEFLFPGTSQFDRNAIDEVKALRVLDSTGPWTWQRAAREMFATKPDVAVLRYWMPFFAPAMGSVAGRLRKRGVKVISIVDNALPHERHFYDKPLTRWFLKKNNGLIAMTSVVRDDIIGLYPEARVELMPHPLYDHFGTQVPKNGARARLELPSDARVVLFFGLIRDYKGLDLLIDAMGRLDQRHHLVIAGEPYGDFASFQRMIAVSPRRANIHVHAHYIADAEVPMFFSAADVAVLPYKSATQSGITAIAHHFGVPVISTNVGGLKEGVQHERTGIIADAPDADAISRAISLFFESDRPLRFGTNINALRDELSWKRFGDGLVRFARSL